MCDLPIPLYGRSGLGLSASLCFLALTALTRSRDMHAACPALRTDDAATVPSHQGSSWANFAPPAIRILRPGGKDYTRCFDRGLFPAEVFEVIFLEAGFGFFMRACSDMSLALDLFNCTTIFLKSLT